MPEMGEYLVGAWLKVKKNCDFIQYNARLPEAGLKGLGEVDVIGLDFKKKVAYLCEVTTHLDGVLYGTYSKTMEKLRAKFRRDREFADKMLEDFPERHFMFWSPVVPEGKLTSPLTELEKTGVELVMNRSYTERINELKEAAQDMVNDTGNLAFRLLQILGHLRT